jgi:ATP-dependent helicase/nuclease subunit A
MMSKPIDHRAREQALNPHGSYIIQAPAGSGKTELLTQRVLSLLAGVEQPEEILAITFTRKAASEMRERIIKALQFAARVSTAPDKDHEAKTWSLAKAALKRDQQQQWQLLNNPQRLQIQTIDGFCSSLTKRLPYLSELGCEANASEQVDVLYQKAAKEALFQYDKDDPEWRDSVQTLLLHLDGNLKRAQQLMIDMLKKRDQWLRIWGTTDDSISELKMQLEESLFRVVDDKLAEINQQLPAVAIESLQAHLNYAWPIALKNKPAFAKCGFDGQLTLPIDTDNLANWQAMLTWLLTAKNEWRKKADKNLGFPPGDKEDDKETKALRKEKKEAFTEWLKQYQDLAETFAELSIIPPAQYQDNEWQALHAFMFCLKRAAALLKLTFRDHNEMDFAEISIRAAEALGTDDNPTDLNMALDYQLKHILIDEFQDTSYSQSKLLERLIRGWQEDEGNTLFLVGDPMQSIYRFREADVGQFITARNKGIRKGNDDDNERMPLEALNLEVNFRSERTIVDWVNQCFTRLFPSKEDILSGAVSYAPSIAFNEAQTYGVEVLPCIGDIEDEAAQLVSFIQQKRAEAPDESIAVLVRSRSQLQHLLPIFNEAGLRYKATEIERLGTLQLITDLQMLTRALTDITDRIAWLAIMRAPWCGLLLDDLEIIAGEAHSCIYLNASNDNFIKQLSDDAQQRLASLLENLQPWLPTTTSIGLRERVEGAWLALHGPALIDDQAQLAASDLYFNLLQKHSPKGLLLEPEIFNQQLGELYIPTDQQADKNLQLMTIHKSKGLEFDTVILPNLNHSPKSGDNSLLHWKNVSFNDGDQGLVMAPVHEHVNNRNKIYDFLTKIDKEQDSYEGIRQLYVACTRAKKQLVLSANIQPNKKQALSPTSNSQLKQFWPFVEDAFNAAFEQSATLEQAETDADELAIELDEQPHEQLTDRPIRRLAKSPQLIEQYLATKPEAEQILDHDSEQKHQFEDEPVKRLVGILTHFYLEHIALAKANWQPTSLEPLTPLIEQQLLSLGLPKGQLTTAKAMVLENLTSSLACSDGQYILGDHQGSLAEFGIEALVTSPSEQIKSFYIDRSFVDAEGVRWIIDYKTSSASDENPNEQFFEKQLALHRAQLENYGHLMSVLEQRPIMLGLYFTRYQRLIKWRYEQSS